MTGAALHQPLQVQVDFDAIMFYMLHNDNIISTSVSEAIEKIPVDAKRLSQMLLYVFYFAQPQQLQRVDQHTANSRNTCLPTRIHPVYLKNHRRRFT